MSYCYEYPRPGLAVDMLLLRQGQGGLEVLLIQRGHPPFEGRWALPGGFVEENEPLLHAAQRELHEETGLEGIALRQFAAFGDPGRDPRGWMVSVVYWAWLGTTTLPVTAGDDAAAARWWPLEALPPLAFDHADILATATATIAHYGMRLLVD